MDGELRSPIKKRLDSRLEFIRDIFSADNFDPATREYIVLLHPLYIQHNDYFDMESTLRFSGRIQSSEWHAKWEIDSKQIGTLCQENVGISQGIGSGELS